MINWRLKFFKHFLLCTLGIGLLALAQTHAQDNDAAWDEARCFERPLHLERPRSYPYLWCLELIFHDSTTPILGFSALTVGDDGTLYGTRPLYGEVFAFEDTNDDDLPDSPRLIADGLTLPNGLDWHEGSLYLSGGKHIYRLNPDDGQVDVLVNDLPFDGGLWTGDVLVAPDERLYVGVSSKCDDCIPENPEQGAILSFDLEGGDRRIVAQGFRQPQGLMWYNDALWVTDTAPRSFLSATETETRWLDEVNRIEIEGHYGFPYCVGDSQPHVESQDFDCANALSPTVSLPTQSNPIAIIPYQNESGLPLNNQLIIALSGSSQAVDVRGYQIVSLEFDDEGAPSRFEIVVPFQAAYTAVRAFVPYQTQGAPLDGLRLSRVNDLGDGIWPHHILDMTQSSDGWVYFTMSDGRIIVLRS